MQTYHKINSLYKRHVDGKKKGKLIEGEWATPEIGYLSNNLWEFTEKVDGTNIRVGYTPGMVVFGGRTEKSELPGPLSEWLMANLTAEVFANAGFEDGVTLYGEGYGPKIQSGENYSPSQKFVLFDVKIGDFWLSRPNVIDVASKLGLDAVPVIGRGTLFDAMDIVRSGFIFNNAGGIERYGRGTLQSAWGDFDAEGIVARPVVDMFDRFGNRIITKIKKVDFNGT